MNNKPNQKYKFTTELRNAEFIENENEKILEGYAIVFNKETVLFEEHGVQYKEIISRNALDDCDLKDVCFKYNHGDAMGILARTRNGSLQLLIDDYGLKFRAKLLNTNSANEIYECVKNGLLDKCSFAFRVEQDSYNNETNTVTIEKIKRVYELSVVDIPAYDDTNIEARSYFDGFAKFDVMEKNKRVKRLLLKTYC